MTYQILEAKDYKGLTEMFFHYALEVTPDEEPPLGTDTVYLIAKVPNFFKKSGFVTIEFNSAPNIAKCLSCKQYKIDCFPEIMHLNIS